MSIVTLRDLRPAFTGARDQGSRPTCIAFATSDAHAAARGLFQLLSVEHLYYHAIKRTPGGHPSDGVTLSTTLEALRHDGQSLETGWPYLDPLPSNLATWQPPSNATPVFRHESALAAKDSAEIIGYLETDRPVIITLLISERFVHPIAGIITPVMPDPDVDYHAVVAVGHGHNGSKPFVLVRNSWGPDWAIEGHAWVDVDYLEPRLVGLAIMTTVGVA